METHTGGCHCGAVRYEARGDMSKAIVCNCSHCEAKGLALAFIPLSDLTITAGEDELTDYYFNKHVIRHRFCGRCGVQPFGFGEMPDGTKMASINVRTLDGHEFDSVILTPFEGRGA